MAVLLVIVFGCLHVLLVFGCRCLRFDVCGMVLVWLVTVACCLYCGTLWFVWWWLCLPGFDVGFINSVDIVCIWLMYSYLILMVCRLDMFVYYRLMWCVLWF